MFIGDEISRKGFFFYKYFIPKELMFTTQELRTRTTLVVAEELAQSYYFFLTFANI